MKQKLLFFFALITLFSCSSSDDTVSEPDTQTGTISFTFNPNQKDNSNPKVSKKSFEDKSPMALVLSITTLEGASIVENQSYPLIRFNDSFITTAIEFPVGEYLLTTFNVVNEANEVIFSAPLEGSEFAALVRIPLPLPFTITEGNDADNPQIISPEVLEIESEDTPEQFGYASFTFNVVSTQNLFLQVNLDSLPSSTSAQVSIALNGRDFQLENLPLTPNEVNRYRIPFEFDRDIVIRIELETGLIEDIVLSNPQIAATSVANPYIVDLGSTGNSLTPREIKTVLLGQANFSTTNNSNQSITFDGFDSLNDIKLNPIANSNEILVTFLSNVLFTIDSRTNSTQGFELVRNNNNSFNSILSYDNGYFLIGRGNIYRYEENLTDGLLFTRMDYNNIDDNLFNSSTTFVANNKLFVSNGGTLYRSDDFGASFSEVNSNFSSIATPNFRKKLSDRVVTDTNGTIYVLSEGGQIFSSTDDGVTFNEVINLNNDSLTHLYLNSSNYFVAAGNFNLTFIHGDLNSGTNVTTANFESDPDDGPFVGYVVNQAGNINNIFYENTHYRGSVSGADALEIANNLSLAKSININQLEGVVVAENEQSIYGLNFLAVFLNLERF